MTDWYMTPPARHALPSLLEAIPLLQTSRLRLRAMMLQDLPLLAEINADVAATSLRGDTRDVWDDFVQMAVTWVLRGHGWWTLEDEKGAAGFVGLGFEPGDREPELGYLLAPAGRGKGYATEACEAARNWAWQVGRLPSLVSYIADHNTASQNVARKLGAARDAAAEAALNEDRVQVWRHPNPAKDT